MSRPPPPPSPIHPKTTSASASTMMETQKLPSFPPPPFLGHPFRRLPQPVQLPPISIPPQPPRPEYHYQSPQPPAAVHSAPPLRPHERAFPGPAAPVPSLLSSNPYTPPRPGAPYSPRPGPAASPQSQPEVRPPPGLLADRYPPSERRGVNPEPPLVSPIDAQQKASYPPTALPSPSRTAGYSAINAPFRPSIGALQGPLPPPPPSLGHPTGPSAYSELPPVESRPTSCAGSALQAGLTPGLAAATIPNVIRPGLPPDKANLHYELIVRQQPIAARACGFGERDRRVIDPPPIIELRVTDPKTNEVDMDELRYSLNVVHCTLWNEKGTNEETALVQQDKRTTRRLMGQLVASPSVAKDEHDKEGCFFCFPDLSCRTHGKYRLRFVLMRIDPMNLHVGGFSPILTEVLSDVFTVYTAKDFPGMRPSSALTRALKLQGCNIQVKKGNEKALARKRANTSDEDDDGGGESRKQRRR